MFAPSLLVPSFPLSLHFPPLSSFRFPSLPPPSPPPLPLLLSSTLNFFSHSRSLTHSQLPIIERASQLLQQTNEAHARHDTQAALQHVTTLLQDHSPDAVPLRLLRAQIFLDSKNYHQVLEDTMYVRAFFLFRSSCLSSLSPLSVSRSLSPLSLSLLSLLCLSLSPFYV